MSHKPRHAKPGTAAKASRAAKTAVAGGAATTAAAAAVLGVPAFAAHAAATTATAVTQISARPDSGFGGNTWASDTMRRTATVTLTGPDATLADCGAGATACFTYTGTIRDTGTADAVTGAVSPGAQAVAIKGAPVAAVKGGTSVQFHASSDAPDASLVPHAVTGAGTAGQSTGNWVEQFFPAGTTFGAGPAIPDWSWKYTDATHCQAWTDAFNVTQAASGDITGADACTTSVAGTAPQAVTVGTPYSLQVHGSTTGSDKSLAYSATGLPDGLAIGAKTGVISGTPKADAVSGTATVTVTDFGGVSATAAIGFTVKQAVTPPPPPPPAVRPHLYGGHVITVNNNDAQIGWKDGPGVHYVLTRTFGYGFSPNGSPHIGFTGITTGFWSGLAAGHTYDIELIPAGANRQPLPHAQVGWITIVTTR